MSYPSIQRMLQQALNLTIFRLLQSSLALAQIGSIDWQLQTSDLHAQPSLHMTRRSWPVEYISGLSLQLAAQTAPPAEWWAAQIIREFPNSWHLAHPGQSCPHLTAAPSGQIRLQLAPNFTTDWLAMLMVWSPLPTHVQSHTVEVDWLSPAIGSVGETLHLSPLALVQYLHARCHQLLQWASCPLDLNQRTPGQARSNLPADGYLRWTEVDKLSLVRTLIQVVDRLEQLTHTDQEVNARQVVAEVCRLGESINRWWDHSDLSAILTGEGLILLQSLQTVLRVVLIWHFHQIPVNSL